ncbi:MAG TPA: ABC-type transport auxiliary lipoprotein family protein [Microvirga sp.]
MLFIFRADPARPLRRRDPTPAPAGARAPARGRAKSARFAAVGLLAALAAACSSTPTPTTYDLTAPTGRARGALAGQVLVAEPVAVQALSGQQILVKDASGSISFLGNGQWADNLPRLVQARLIHTFENSSQLKAVARPSTGAAGDVQLISEIRSFQIATPANEAEVEISAKVVSDQNGRIIAGRIFRGRVPVTAIDAPNAARALDEALSGVMLEIVRWTGGVPVPVRPTEPPPAEG